MIRQSSKHSNFDKSSRRTVSQNICKISLVFRVPDKLLCGKCLYTHVHKADGKNWKSMKTNPLNVIFQSKTWSQLQSAAMRLSTPKSEKELETGQLPPQIWTLQAGKDLILLQNYQRWILIESYGYFKICFILKIVSIRHFFLILHWILQNQNLSLPLFSFSYFSLILCLSSAERTQSWQSSLHRRRNPAVKAWQKPRWWISWIWPEGKASFLRFPQFSCANLMNVVDFGGR